MPPPRHARALSIFGVFALSAAVAHADPAVGEASLSVRVGATVSLDVGFARGLRCDDLTIVSAELRGETRTSNRLYVTGLKPGVTQCRAGTTSNPTVLVTITVTPAK